MSFSPVLLQVVADTAQMAAAAAPVTKPAVQEQLSLWYLLKEGGVLMIPLLICSLIAIYVFFERFLAIRKAMSAPTDFMQRVKEKIVEGNLNGAQSLCKNYDGSVPRVVSKGISRIGKPIDHIEKSMENSGKLEVYAMEKNVGILSTIAGIAPIFGFLGTIVGMIIMFYNIQHDPAFSINSVAGGIYTKLVTSATGLIIGLVSFVGYNYLNALINRGVNKIETSANELLDILHEPAHR
ncbi:MotA/TolQ/ExbB proton channel family protein [Edaphocola flava]|jgi:biopolymer transport protein ExbB|uniref:MotA/TolQ/ExbB proton channel family protein n=1 Tax=Edaphocola flava TaxID=2499629 RepID=UPI00100B1EC9|nr:MotA/TolQ/ExbB proton channel family protein [Edaphocola flava]